MVESEPSPVQRGPVPAFKNEAWCKCKCCNDPRIPSLPSSLSVNGRLPGARGRDPSQHPAAFGHGVGPTRKEGGES